LKVGGYGVVDFTKKYLEKIPCDFEEARMEF